jgi:hypothetical protein
MKIKSTTQCECGHTYDRHSFDIGGRSICHVLSWNGNIRSLPLFGDRCKCNKFQESFESFVDKIREGEV